jgi:hypothetical protein
MPTDRELDQLIDAALSSYSAMEARPGLERRILANALADHPRQRRLAWAWSFAIPAAACLLLFLFFAERHHSSRSTLEATATTAPLTNTASPREAPATKSLPSQKRSIPHNLSTQPSTAPERLPKQDVFPSPSPLTAEEQTLFAYNRSQLRATIAHRGTQLEINPLTISELQIEPLDIPALDQPALSPSESGRNEQQP